MASIIEVELLRGKGYPQTEDDPNPCTTQARVTILEADGSTVMAAEQCSSIQENSNSPFYKDVLTFTPKEGSSNGSEGVVLVKIAEFSRKSEPFILFYGPLRFTAAEFRAKKEVVIPLSSNCPVVGDEANGNRIPPAADERCPTLSLRMHIRKAKNTSEQNMEADVDLKTEDMVVNGSTQLVPAHCEYVWLRLVSDTKWTEAYRYALAVYWRSRSPLIAPAQSAKAKTAAGAGGKKLPVAAPAPEAELRTVGDVILKKWCCRRVHQVLTRVRLTAEKHSKGDRNLGFSPEEEVQHRTEKKSRAKMLETLCLETLKKTDNSNLRHWLERLWVLFAVGIDNDPAGAKSLSYDVRKRVHDAPFEEDDAALLQASLLYFFIPSLPFEECQSIAEQEVRATLSKQGESDAQKQEQKPQWKGRFTQSQQYFTTTLVSFAGPLMETLTETELLKAFKTFKPAVQDANQRIAKGGKAGIHSRLRNTEAVRGLRGDGISIKHLDKLGHRKESPKFA